MLTDFGRQTKIVKKTGMRSYVSHCGPQGSLPPVLLLLSTLVSRSRIFVNHFGHLVSCAIVTVNLSPFD